ncbi:MAG: DUF2062 domain-containing protein [Deltaproteobacteria bacterium]|nr:DUF2062 domain-containing protein [Deltaproteobacteria bacterium]
MKTLSRLIYVHLILPFQQSNASISHAAWGASIGMLVAFTPTVGIQMYISGTIWVVCRYIFRFHFNLPIALAMVWITNPITMGPIYFGFLVTGEWMLETYHGTPHQPLNYAYFKEIIAAVDSGASASWGKKLVDGFAALFWQFGWPMVVGSVLWAVPLALITYPTTFYALYRYRVRLARMEGIPYSEWKNKHLETQKERR